MAATAGHRLTLDPMGKCSNAFFSETTNMIKIKLCMNVHWIVLYKGIDLVPEQIIAAHQTLQLCNLLPPSSKTACVRLDKQLCI
jgi:hypothetical protein